MQLTAIIAGTGILPVEACKSLKTKNIPFFVISLFPEDNFDALEQLVETKNDIIKKDVYKAAEILALLKNKNTKQVLLIGKVEKNHLLKKIKLDWLTIKLLARMLYHGDKAIMEKILETFQKVNDLMAEINSATSEQSSAVEEINKAVTNLDSANQENATHIDQMAGLSQKKAAEAAKLDSLVDLYFR